MYMRAAVHWGKVVDKTIKFVLIETQCIEQPLCTDDILPDSSWYAPGVLMVSFQCIELLQALIWVSWLFNTFVL